MANIFESSGQLSAEDFMEVEKKFLYPYYNLIAFQNGLDEEINVLIEAVSSGNYYEALQLPIMKTFLLSSGSSDSWETISEYFKNNLNSILGNEPSIKTQICLLSLGIIVLQLFVQNNFTGPKGDALRPCVFKDLVVTDKKAEDLDEMCMKELSIDAEEIYNLVHSPLYLLIAKIIFIDLRKQLKDSVSIEWWCIRCVWVYQKVLDERSQNLYEIFIKASHDSNINDVFLSGSQLREIKALFHLEMIYIHLYYYGIGMARTHLEKASSILGMKTSIDGAMGKRTKWQQRDLPQLVLKVQFENLQITSTENGTGEPTLLKTDLPKDVNLNDDTRLERINFKDADEDVIPDLKPIEQAVVLAELIILRRSQAQDLSLLEQSKAYIWALTQHPRNWVIQFTSLYTRSIIESDECRAMERSMNQLEELVSSIVRGEPSRFERSKLFYSSLMLSHWEVEQESAKMFMRLGCVKTALEIFERLELWDDVIICYNELQMRQRSAELVRQLIEKKGETPKLLCLLGDATDDLECYYKAWELSNKRSFRAQRSLGNYYYVRKEYKKAIEHYEISVDLSKIQFPVWQRLAYCALQTEDWDLCAKAYRTCSVLEPESFECWNNLSQAYLKTDQIERAWKTLQEAIRCRNNSWRVWDNFMLVSTSLGYFSHAIHAYNQILSLKEKHIDTQILGRIVKGIIEALKPDNRESTVNHKNCSQLVAKLTREVPTNAELWYLYGDITFHTPDASPETIHTAMQYYRKSVAASTQKPGWEKDTVKAEFVIQRSLKLLETASKATKEANPKSAIADLSSIKLSVRSILVNAKRGQTNITTGEYMPGIKEHIESLDCEFTNLVNTIEQLKVNS